MLEEIYKSYLFILINDNVENYIKITIAKDCISVCNDIIRKINNNEIIYSKSDKENLINKFELIKNISIDLLKNKSVSTILPRYLLLDIYINEKDFIYKIKEAKVNSSDVEEIINLLTEEKQYLNLSKEINNLKHFIDKFESRRFKKIDELVDEAFNKIETIYFNLMKNKLAQQDLNIETHIDFSKLKEKQYLLFEKMKQFYSNQNQISSGYKSLDNLLEGGFEKTRVYLFAGRSGIGKSILLLNFFSNLSKSVPKDEYVLFITLENLVFENLLRLLAMKMKQPTFMIKKLIKEGNQNILNELEDFSRSNLILSYFPARTFSVGDLFSYVEQLNAERKQKPFAIIVDYLDIMKLPTNVKEMRHQLGTIAMGLKTIAVKYQIPVITASQLNKEGYDSKPNLKNIKESSDKIDNIDVIGLLWREGDIFSINLQKSRHCKEGVVNLNINSDFYLIQDPPEVFLKIYETKEKKESKKQETILFSNPEIPVNNIQLQNSIQEDISEEIIDSSFFNI